MMDNELLHSLRCCLTQAIARYQHVHGKNPGVILAESDAYIMLLHDTENSRFFFNGEETWRGYPLKLISSKGMGIYLPENPVELVMVRRGESLVFRYREEEMRNG